MAMPVDLELKKAFGDLQCKMHETSQKIQIIDAKIGVMKKVQQHLEAKEVEIYAFPAKTRVYETIGRMFLLTTLKDVKLELKECEAHLIASTKKLESDKEYLEKNLKESHDNIREMVQQRKEQSETKSP